MPAIAPSDPRALIEAQRGISRLVERDLRAAFRTLPIQDAGTTRDAMLHITEQVVNRYGEIGANFAADWYDSARIAKRAPRRWTAAPLVADRREAVIETVRRVAGDLFTDHPETMIDRLVPHAQQYALASMRTTITSNADHDRSARGWVRVTNPGACDYCIDLANEDTVWSSEDGADFEAHTGCNCTAAPAF